MIKKILGLGLVGAGLVVACDNESTDPVVVTDTGCTVVDNNDGSYELTCGGATITVRDGTNGSEGTRGPKGPKGSNGVSGFDGTPGTDGGKGDQGDKGDTGASCTVGPLLYDGESGLAGSSGMGGDLNGQAQPGKFVVRCGEASVVISDGLSTLLDIVADDTVCKDGGHKITSGVDNDRDHVLDPSEVIQIRYLCNGAPAISWLMDVETVGVDESLHCVTTGGLIVTSGPDQNRDGILQAGEIETTSAICNGSNGLNSLVMTSPEPVGTNCAEPGLKVESGLDDNNNGTLGEDEVDQTSYLCLNPCGNYGGVNVQVNDNIAVCNTALQWGEWDSALIGGGWTVCDKAQWAAYAPSASPGSFGLASLWIDNDSCGESNHREVYEGFPMNDSSCYDGEQCCWDNSRVLQFAVCAPFLP